MSFPLSARNILSCEVYVNETGMHPASVLRQLAESEGARVTHNFLGDISECFVLWEERADFDASKPGDRHYLIDRMNNTIHFGDGINVMAPRAQNGESFTVTARCTGGAAGNLPAGAIDAPQGRLLYVGSIGNPVETWGGSDIESTEKAHLRGANVLSSQNRLISAADFEREILGYSSSVRKVRCIVGQTPDKPEADGAISVAVLTDGYRTHSFAELKDNLKRLILQKCEAGLREDLLVITEPIYVSISISLFLQTSVKSFTIKNKVIEHLENFLDPLSPRNGWDIGVLPDEAQIKFRLGTGDIPGEIRGFTATARWQDGAVVRESTLDGLPKNPFMIGVSGSHTVHITEN